MLDKNRQEQIITTLKQKGASQPCPRCRNLEFDIVGEAEIPLIANQLARWSESLSAHIPILLVACSNCGYIAMHAIAVLGLKR
jgi:predicted nucleic-acid-binding Zn-ribbon protein